MSELPALVVDASRSLLARWLRLAGFPVELAPRRRGVAAAGVARKGADAWLELPEEDWRIQLAAVLRWLDLGPEALRPLARCARCGGRLDPLSRKAAACRLPPRACLGYGPYFACADCGRPAWKGPAQLAHVRELEELVLEFLFRCARCGVEAEAAGSKCSAKVELRFGRGPVEISEDDLRRDHMAEIASILRRLEGMSERQMVDGVAFVRDRALCGPCGRLLQAELRRFFDPPTAPRETQ